MASDNDNSMPYGPRFEVSEEIIAESRTEQEELEEYEEDSEEYQKYLEKQIEEIEKNDD